MSYLGGGFEPKLVIIFISHLRSDALTIIPRRKNKRMSLKMIGNPAKML